VILSDEDNLLLYSASGSEYKELGGLLTNRQARHRREYLKRNGYPVVAWTKLRSAKEERQPEPAEPPANPDEWGTYFQELEEAALVYQGVHACEERTLEIVRDEHRPIALVCIGDFHFGNKGVRYDLINRDMELIEQTEGTVAIGMGDYVDNFKVNSKAASGLYGAIEPNPEYQEDWASRRMGMVSKWAALIDGNHDDRNFQAAGLSSSTIAIAGNLGVPAFSQAGAGVKITVGAQSYFAIMKHNFRGNSGISKGNEARRMWDEWPWHWDNADLVCLAHTHEPHIEIPRRKGRPVVYARSGTYKQGDSYAEMKGYRSGYGPSFFVLYPDKHLIVPLPQESFTENIEIFKQIRDRYAPK
jgi:predicted phosphodiesterase